MEDIIETTVRIIFEKNDGTYTFRDALHFTQEEYASITQEDIENLKQARFDNWISITTSVEE
jgi:hypothetical protein